MFGRNGALYLDTDSSQADGFGSGGAAPYPGQPPPGITARAAGAGGPRRNVGYGQSSPMTLAEMAREHLRHPVAPAAGSNAPSQPNVLGLLAAPQERSGGQGHGANTHAGQVPWFAGTEATQSQSFSAAALVAAYENRNGGAVGINMVMGEQLSNAVPEQVNGVFPPGETSLGLAGLGKLSPGPSLAESLEQLNTSKQPVWCSSARVWNELYVPGNDLETYKQHIAQAVLQTFDDDTFWAMARHYLSSGLIQPGKR